MRYLPHTGEDIEAMLETIGVSDLEGLFETLLLACFIWSEDIHHSILVPVRNAEAAERWFLKVLARSPHRAIPIVR